MTKLRGKQKSEKAHAEMIAKQKQLKLANEETLFVNLLKKVGQITILLVYLLQ